MYSLQDKYISLLLPGYNEFTPARIPDNYFDTLLLSAFNIYLHKQFFCPVIYQSGLSES